MAQRILKPLDYGAMLDELFDLYKKNFLLLSGITGIIYLPFTTLYYHEFMSVMNSIQSERVPGTANLISLGLVLLLYIPASFFVTAATTWAVSNSYLGNKSTIIGSYKAIFKRIVPFALTMTLSSLLLMAGTIAFCIPGIIIFFAISFVSQVFIIEGKQYVDAIKRSFELVKSEWVKVLVFAILTNLVVSTITAALTAPFTLMQAFSGAPATGTFSIIQGLAQGIAQTLALPIQVIAFVLLYYDIRIRKEGFDIEMLAAGMESSTTLE